MQTNIDLNMWRTSFDSNRLAQSLSRKNTESRGGQILSSANNRCSPHLGLKDVTNYLFDYVLTGNYNINIFLKDYKITKLALVSFKECKIFMQQATQPVVSLSCSDGLGLFLPPN